MSEIVLILLYSVPRKILVRIDFGSNIMGASQAQSDFCDLKIAKRLIGISNQPFQFSNRRLRLAFLSQLIEIFLSICSKLFSAPNLADRAAFRLTKDGSAPSRI